MHHGLAAAKREQRARVLADAIASHPERFPNGLPTPRALPTAVWINPPAKRADLAVGDNPVTRNSNEVAIVIPGASAKAVPACAAFAVPASNGVK